jgi:hypothetical protein
MIVFALGAGTAYSAEKSDTKYTATRAIAVDQATGKFRKPTQAEIQKIVTDLRSMTRRPTITRQVSLKGGGTMASLDGGFQGVVLARPRSDGSYETRCVFTFEEGAAFLGLVAADSAQQ